MKDKLLPFQTKFKGFEETKQAVDLYWVIMRRIDEEFRKARKD